MMIWAITAIMIASFMFGYWVNHAHNKQLGKKPSTIEAILNGVLFSFGWFVIWLTMALT